MIEQASILSTHGLGVLVDRLDLAPLLDFRVLATHAYTSVLDRLERRVLPERIPYRTRLQSTKNLAFAWRQMLYFLARLSDEEQRAFTAEAHALLAARSELARTRFTPYLSGLEEVVAGATIDRGRRLYGWSIDRPALPGEKPPPASSR